MPEQLPHPFRPGEHVPGARVTQDDRQELAAGLAEHVLGQPLTHLDFVRTHDAETSRQLGVPVDTIDLTLYLGNNVAYCARLVVPSLALLSRGEALAHILPGQPHYVTPAIP